MTQTFSRERYLQNALTTRASTVMIRGNTRTTVFMAPSPPYIEHGEGAYITDSSGHKVLDANNNYTALIHGHNDLDIRAAVETQLKQGVSFGLPTEPEVELAELLKNRTGHERWRFSNSGTEAVMTAIRAARAATGRSKIVRFQGSYHGTSDAVVDPHAPGITPGTSDDVIVLPQGDESALMTLMADHGKNIAAVLIDLMPNRAGLEPAAFQFVQNLREVTEKVGALLIVDEVITLRLGTGGMTEAYGVEPDLVTVGKIVGGGFPIGAVGGREEILRVFDPLGDDSVGWGGTFSANPVSMIAGKTALEKFDRECVDMLNSRGDRLRETLRENGLSVSGQGSLIRIRERVPIEELWWSAYQRGLFISTNGLIAISTAMDEHDLAKIAEICLAAMRDIKSKY